jgi:hypothetical protein
MKPGDYEGEELLYRCLITITFTKILLEPQPCTMAATPLPKRNTSEGTLA